MRSPNALHYEEVGPREAPAILFLHGITGSRRYWRRKVLPLRDRWRLILPDLLGFGLSPKPHVEYRMEVFRDSVRSLIEELDLGGRPLFIVAHSLGGLVALEYAALHGAHIQRMVLFSLPRFHDKESAHEVFWRGSPHYRRLLNQHSLSETLAQMKRTGIEVTVRYLFRFPWTVLVDSHKFTLNSLTSTLDNCLLNYQVDSVLPRVPPIPTLLIHGERDSVAPLAHLTDLTTFHPHIRLTTVAGTGHHVFLTHTRRCLSLMREFLEEGSTTQGRSSIDTSSVSR
jgi:pimeloyl-ACP methyl ester carboxylesterase